jgi:hypothetical protein
LPFDYRAYLNKEEFKPPIFSKLNTQQLVAEIAGLNSRQVCKILKSVICSALKKSKEKTSVDLQGPSFPLDLQSKVFWAVLSKDMWMLKQLLSPLFCSIINHNDALLKPVSSDLGKIICNLLLDKLIIIVDEQSGDEKQWVKLAQLGENTMFPMKHCRWCGYMSVSKFKVCSMCKECPEYLDINVFCCAECEKAALDKQHREEHARFYMVKLNMD